MTIAEGQRLPETTLRYQGADGPQEVQLSEKLAGRKVLIFGMPGAFTGTCTSMHVPSIVAQADAIRAKGVDEIIVLVVNDVQVTKAWAEATGATDAGVTVVSEPTGAFGKDIGLSFDAPVAGFYNRLVRHAMVVEDGVLTKLVIEEGAGVCDMTGGAALLDLI